MNKKFNEELAIKAIRNKKNQSVAAVLREIGLYDRNGYNYSNIYKTVKKYNLDISHWLGQAINRKKIFGPKYPIFDYLDNKRHVNSHTLKLRLFKEKVKEKKCERCHNDLWLGESIPLELHHMDGNRYNNSLGNLQILCPNCHAKTSNFSREIKKKLVDESTLKDAIISSYSFSDALKKVGMNNHGKSYDRIRKVKEKYNLEFLQRSVTGMNTSIA